MRDEGHNLISALEETLAISHATGVPAHVSHFKALGRNNLHLFGTALDLIDKALNEGIPVTADLYPYDSRLHSIEGGAPVEHPLAGSWQSDVRG